jgi:hypothetical protein
MTDYGFPEGVKYHIGSAICSECGTRATSYGKHATPPAGWFLMKVNFYDGNWPPIQPLDQNGNNSVLFCSLGCAVNWLAKWGTACEDGRYLPAPTEDQAPDAPPRYLRLVRD